MEITRPDWMPAGAAYPASHARRADETAPMQTYKQAGPPSIEGLFRSIGPINGKYAQAIPNIRPANIGNDDRAVVGGAIPAVNESHSNGSTNGSVSLPSFLSGANGSVAGGHGAAVVAIGAANSNSGNAPAHPSRDRIRQDLVERAREYYESLLGERATRSGGSLMFKCPFHDDTHASLCVGVEHGGFRCMACGESGDVLTIWMKIKGVPFREALDGAQEWLGGQPLLVKEKRKRLLSPKIPQNKTITEDSVYSQLKTAQEILVKAANPLAHLRSWYGVSCETLVRFKCGWDAKNQRLWIPVYKDGELINVRKHDILRAHCVWQKGEEITRDRPRGWPKSLDGWKPIWDAGICRKNNKLGMKVFGVRDHNSVAVFPTDAISEAEHVVITGGELKAIYLNQVGIPAVCFTGGEGTFSASWLPIFAGKSVEICMDADDAGRAGAERLAQAVAEVARQTQIVDLPHGDVNDYYRDRNWDFSDWKNLKRRQVLSKGGEDFIDIPFQGLRQPKYCGVPVQFRSIAAGTGETPYFIVGSATATCTRGEVDPIPSCKSCPLPGRGFRCEINLPDDDVIELVGRSPRKQEKYLIEQVARIPEGCPHPSFEFRPCRVQMVGLVQDVDSLREDASDEERGTYFIHKGYYLGNDEVSENEPHVTTGTVIADPKTSEATLIIKGMQAARRSHEYEGIDSEVIRRINALPGDSGSSVDAVAKRLSFYVEEFSERICHIYDQPFIMLGQLYNLFMPIRFSLMGAWNQKIGAETLYIGDSRAGKTATARSLLRHFRAGRFISCEGATFAGLVGGSDTLGTKKFFTWGAMPTQDGGVVVLDELDGIIESGVFSQLTSIRSDGIASRTIAGGLRQCQSRLRMLMLTNPKGSRTMQSYTSAMHAITDLIDSQQDVARFEYVVAVHRKNEPEIYNRAPQTGGVVYHTELASKHLRWAWHQKPILQGSIVQAIYDEATKISNQFKGLPLFAATEGRFKVGRLACAIAALCGSMDEDYHTLVTEAHVLAAAHWFDTLYGDGKFAYNKFVGAHIDNPEGVVKYLVKLGAKSRDFIRQHDFFTNDSIDLVVSGVSNRNEFLSILLRDNPCLMQRKGGYVKTEAFKEILAGG